MRITEACEFLAKTNLPIREISEWIHEYRNLYYETDRERSEDMLNL